jgi:hypothetical protein
MTCETRAARPLCRCRASDEALTRLGFPVEKRVHALGAWHVEIPGMSARRARSAATQAGAVTLICECGRTQAAIKARLAAREGL